MRSRTADGTSRSLTTFVATPNADAVIDDVAAVEFIARRARDAKLAKVYCAATVTQGLAGKEISEFGLLSEAGVVAFSDGDRALSDSLVMSRALSYARAFDAITGRRALGKVTLRMR